MLMEFRDGHLNNGVFKDILRLSSDDAFPSEFVVCDLEDVPLADKQFLSLFRAVYLNLVSERLYDGIDPSTSSGILSAYP